LAAQCAGANEKKAETGGAALGGDVSHGLRNRITALSDSEPYANWGRWFISDRSSRSIAPEMAATPAEAARLGQKETF
jgi:hypothetical protein